MLQWHVENDVQGAQEIDQEWVSVSLIIPVGQGCGLPSFELFAMLCSLAGRAHCQLHAGQPAVHGPSGQLTKLLLTPDKPRRGDGRLTR